ncbi:UNVERIFIED_CONTAM: hypothetical protein Sradi_3569200 [Sesamum radiatum]|uniref:Uncharacterized protein n=1 Tax=Sesamum radiatum TaxID=300843 RepID=A0AAW2QGG1_SESRA
MNVNVEVAPIKVHTQRVLINANTVEDQWVLLESPRTSLKCTIMINNMIKSDQKSSLLQAPNIETLNQMQHALDRGS